MGQFPSRRRPDRRLHRQRKALMNPQTQLVLLLAFGGAVLVTLGYRIRFRREWHLIGGFDCRNLRDPDGFGRWVGSIGLVLGSVTFGAAAIALTRPDLNAIL